MPLGWFSIYFNTFSLFTTLEWVLNFLHNKHFMHKTVLKKLFHGFCRFYFNIVSFEKKMVETMFTTS